MFMFKSLLRQRNRLRRRGHFDRANIFAVKINVLIKQARSVSFSRPSTATTKELWTAVKKLEIVYLGIKILCCCKMQIYSLITLQRLLQRIRMIAMNLTSSVVKTVMMASIFFYNYEAEKLLSKLKLTAAGCDQIPAWVLRSCSYELADIVTVQ